MRRARRASGARRACRAASLSLLRDLRSLPSSPTAARPRAPLSCPTDSSTLIRHSLFPPPLSPPPYSFAATTTDVALYNALGKAPDAKAYPNVFRYYQHIASVAGKSLPAGVGASTGAASAAAPKASAAAPPKAAAAEEEDVDLFGEDGEEAAKKVAAVEKKAEEAPKKAKKVVIAKTLCMYEVKPLEAGQDMKAMEAALRSIEIDGLVWGQEFKVVDVAYGIQKLMVQFVVEDEKVMLDDVEEKMMAFEDIIQSVDQLSMQKLG